jgi:hypothetical protein
MRSVKLKNLLGKTKIPSVKLKTALGNTEKSAR